MSNCVVCSAEIVLAPSISCSNCLKVWHVNCAKISKDEFDKLTKLNAPWHYIDVCAFSRRGRKTAVTDCLHISLLLYCGRDNTETHYRACLCTVQPHEEWKYALYRKNERVMPSQVGNNIMAHRIDEPNTYPYIEYLLRNWNKIFHLKICTRAIVQIR
ncbi:uncharacterized protein LOC112691624 isoform X2 [Sipha flava]|uniref:Uncharacterized protein LOC112691624 isoform X2 n=3 Tax=Sipha flava TaxID=143950 RepID=A0A8B8GGL3_9HEMI|nr:uncharacterized protein LOC112691624 isoform X2 [Sipha flava]